MRKKALAGDPVAVTNTACEYRIAGRPRLAFKWWKKRADVGDGDEAAEIAYCYQHGIGVRKNLKAAEAAYQQAINSHRVTPYGMEEAQYLLAVMIIAKNPSGRRRTQALNLLRKASADGDYPQASKLLTSLRSGKAIQLCFCRRGLRYSLGGAVGCPIHR